MKKEEITICDICTRFITNGDEKPHLMEQTEDGNYCGINAYLGELEGNYRRRITDINSPKTSHTFYCIYNTHSKIYKQINNKNKT